MNNTEEKHIFTTFDTVSVLGLVVGVGLLVFSIVTNAMNSQTTVKAQIETQRFALQILSGSYHGNAIGTNKTAVRTPASATNNANGLAPAGRIGIDPWGEPYYYRNYVDQKGMKVAIVYSSGPDQKAQTNDSNFVTDTEGRLVTVQFGGDDIGTIQKSY